MTVLLLAAIGGTLLGLAGLILTLTTRTKSGSSYYNYKWWAVAPIVAGAVVALCFWIGWGVVAADKISCRNTARVAGLEWQYSLSTGCLYEFHGHWIPEERWRYITEGE